MGDGLRKDFGSMNMDKLLWSIWTVEESQAMASVLGPGEKDGRARGKDDERDETGRRRLTEEDKATCRGSMLHAAARALWPHLSVDMGWGTEWPS
uniref:Uncharacterized protein n=1 Tax=Oryza meridionalis TaxID=40149 RepID=A0A0E0CV55_9ORYZ